MGFRNILKKKNKPPTFSLLKKKMKGEKYHTEEESQLLTIY